MSGYQVDPEDTEPCWCRKCGATTVMNTWRNTEVGCEDCGSHPAIACPECDEIYDMIHNNWEDFDEATYRHNHPLKAEGRIPPSGGVIHE